MAFDAFLKIDGIDGESTDDKHKDWIEILSYSHGVSQLSSGSVSSGGGRSAERCDHQDLVVMKSLDKSSPKLNLYCSDGKHIKEIKLELCRAGGNKEVYMVYKLEDAIVTSVQPSGSAGAGDLPAESVSFGYGKITWTYNETDHKTGTKKGTIEHNWSLHDNKGG